MASVKKSQNAVLEPSDKKVNGYQHYEDFHPLIPAKNLCKNLKLLIPAHICPCFPSIHICTAVRTGNLALFNKTLKANAPKFQSEGTYTLIIRLHHNVIKTGVRMINLSYSRISLADVARKLQLDSSEDAEFIVAKVGQIFGHFWKKKTEISFQICKLEFIVAKVGQIFGNFWKKETEISFQICKLEFIVAKVGQISGRKRQKYPSKSANISLQKHNFPG